MFTTTSRTGVTSVLTTLFFTITWAYERLKQRRTTQSTRNISVEPNCQLTDNPFQERTSPGQCKSVVDKPGWSPSKSIRLKISILELFFFTQRFFSTIAHKLRAKYLVTTSGHLNLSLSKSFLAALHSVDTSSTPLSFRQPRTKHARPLQFIFYVFKLPLTAAMGDVGMDQVPFWSASFHSLPLLLHHANKHFTKGVGSCCRCSCTACTLFCGSRRKQFHATQHRSWSRGSAKGG